MMAGPKHTHAFFRGSLFCYRKTLVPFVHEPKILMGKFSLASPIDRVLYDQIVVITPIGGREKCWHEFFLFHAQPIKFVIEQILTLCFFFQFPVFNLAIEPIANFE
jgi:hypothetical protein